MPDTDGPPVESPTTCFAFDHRVHISLAALAHLFMLGRLVERNGRISTRSRLQVRNSLLCQHHQVESGDRAVIETDESRVGMTCPAEIQLTRDTRLAMKYAIDMTYSRGKHKVRKRQIQMIRRVFSMLAAMAGGL